MQPGQLDATGQGVSPSGPPGVERVCVRTRNPERQRLNRLRKKYPYRHSKRSEESPRFPTPRKEGFLGEKAASE
jgi:hypothetical protein